MPKNLQGGMLDERISVQRAVITYSIYNEPIESFQVIGEIWAKRRDASATEGYRSSEITAQLTVRFTVRYSSFSDEITPKDRIVFRGKSYNILATREVESPRNSFIEIDAVIRDDQ